MIDDQAKNLELTLAYLQGQTLALAAISYRPGAITRAELPEIRSLYDDGSHPHMALKKGFEDVRSYVTAL